MTTFLSPLSGQLLQQPRVRRSMGYDRLCIFVSQEESLIRQMGNHRHLVGAV